MTRPILLSLGSINADFQLRTDAPPEAGRTVMGCDFVRLGGGKAANVALLARRLGHPAELIGRVGDDDLREQALAPLRRAGVGLGAVSVAPGQSTAVSMICVLPDGGKTIALAGNANDAWDAPAREAGERAVAAAPDGSVLVADWEVPPDVVAAILATACRKGLRVVLDPSPSERMRPELLRGIAAMAPNASEAGSLAGLKVEGPEDAARAARHLAGHGVPLVCVKLSDGGCVLLEGGRLTHVPAVPVEVVDSTGAGDAFSGALAVALLEGKDAVAAAAFAVTASHLAVTAYGSQEAYPDRDRIGELLPRVQAGIRAMAAS
ncbi:ribokinase [Teichococcus oryzae]|uniref:Ribokinase n=1 Tax=Teichococcus oryzae TaxID=1608942 RepID=A0A5B2THK1_9PROT|nr:ribokinase [Pseudoroseomonas oryzae]KAA2213418.1 ribokinase [Pseudoroseomonas oryzae]